MLKAVVRARHFSKSQFIKTIEMVLQITFGHTYRTGQRTYIAILLFIGAKNGDENEGSIVV